MSVNTRVFYREISNVGTVGDRESASRAATDRELPAETPTRAFPRTFSSSSARCERTSRG